MKRVVIIGGGLAGLTAAFRLFERTQVVVLDAAPRLGGQVHTELSQGFVIERGGEGFVSSSYAIPRLWADLGMPESELIGQSVLRSYGFDGQTLRALEPGEAGRSLGFQVARGDLGKGIRSLQRGMGSLVAALQGNMREYVALLTGARVRQLQLRGSKLRVVESSGRAHDADAVIVATPAATAASLLAPFAGDAARALSSAATNSSITVELAYQESAIAHALDASGFVVALPAQRDGVRACTFTSRKFVDRAPPGCLSLRLFFRPNDEELRSLSDTVLVERAVDNLGRVFALRGDPFHHWVSRWPNALPVFSDAHRSAVEQLEQALAAVPIVVAGSAFHGTGIDGAVRSGEHAAAICLGEQPASG